MLTATQAAKNEASTTLFVVGFDPERTNNKDLEGVFTPIVAAAKAAYTSSVRPHTLVA
jgi:hypothetical protein